MLAGAVLVLIGVLIFSRPELLAYFVAAMFVIGGFALIAVGWGMRKRVTYHRIQRMWDDQQEPPQ